MISVKIQVGGADYAYRVFDAGTRLKVLVTSMGSLLGGPSPWIPITAQITGIPNPQWQEKNTSWLGNCSFWFDLPSDYAGDAEIVIQDNYDGSIETIPITIGTTETPPDDYIPPEPAPSIPKIVDGIVGGIGDLTPILLIGAGAILLLSLREKTR